MYGECPALGLVEKMNYNLGNATELVILSDMKPTSVEELKKAAWHIEREIARRICCAAKTEEEGK